MPKVADIGIVPYLARGHFGETPDLGITAERYVGAHLSLRMQGGRLCQTFRRHQWAFSPMAQSRIRLLSQSMMKISTSTFRTTKKT